MRYGTWTAYCQSCLSTELFDCENPINYEIQQLTTNSRTADAPFDCNAIFDTSDVKCIEGWKTGTINSIAELEFLPAIQEELPPNTDPTNAYGVKPNTEYSGILTQEGEARWYAFDISNLTKISIFIKSDKNVDADVFMLKLNTDLMQLENTNLSATNMGEEEYFSYVIEEGIYFIGCIYNGFFLKCKLY